MFWENYFLCFFVIIVLSIENSFGQYRLRFRNRQECRDKGPRKFSDLPDVVLTGFIEQTYPSVDGGAIYTGSVLVKRVLRGPVKIQANRITVDGFGDPSLCHSKGQRGESWIFQLSRVSEGYFRLNGTLLKVNLPNLDRMNALVEDRFYRKRPDIVELPCEKKYCENNGICVEESGARTRCICLENCPSTYDPVCGSNGETFVNECKLRMESCRRGVNLFIRYPSPCDSRRTVREASSFVPLTGLSAKLNTLFRDEKSFN